MRARAVHIVTGPQCRENECQPTCPEEHENAASPAIDSENGDEGKDEVHNTGENDVDQDVTDRITSRLKNILGIVENDVDPAPLLKHSQEHSQCDDPKKAGVQEIGRSHPSNLFLRKSFPDLRDGTACIRRAAYSTENSLCHSSLPPFHQPARTFWHKKHQYKKRGGRNGLRPEHPAPSPLPVPGLPDEFHHLLLGDISRDRLRDK